jgi:tetratricopeptide (TPR) repeat protein
MRKRKNKIPPPPWPVSPVPEIPVICEGEDPCEISNTLAKWWGKLYQWLHPWRTRNEAFFQRLPEIEKQCRMNLEYEERYWLSGADCFSAASVSSSHELLGRCLSEYYDPTKDQEAIDEYKKALDIYPYNSMAWYYYIRHFILRRFYIQAAEEINKVNLSLLENATEWLALHILNWALRFPAIGYSIRGDILKWCVAAFAQISERGQSPDAIVIRGLCSPTTLRESRRDYIRILLAGVSGVMPELLPERVEYIYPRFYKGLISHVEVIPPDDA